MAENETEVVETPDEKPESEAKGLRAQNDQLRKENRGLKAEKRDDIIAGIGLNIETGLGLALAEQFDKGDLALDDIAKTATDKYGHEIPEVPPQEAPQNQAIAQGHAALDQIGQTAGSVPIVPAEGDVLAKAEAEGDYNTTMAIKGQQMAEMLRTRR